MYKEIKKMNTNLRSIGIVSNDKYINKIQEDLALKKALEEDCIVEIISWENDQVDYSKYDCLILRSVWGYHNKYREFKKWLEMLKANKIKIFNDVETIENNIRKDVQFSILDKYGIPHVSTDFQRENVDIERYYNKEYIIKPIISGSGEKTFKIDEVDLKVLLELIIDKENGIMIQPYMKEIENGEYSIIFINGENTHNMIRHPGIFSEKEKPYLIQDVPFNVLELAKMVKNIPEYSKVLYMRVDIVGSDTPVIMEVELAEPDLLTRYINFEEPIKKLAKAIRRKL